MQSRTSGGVKNHTASGFENSDESNWTRKPRFHQSGTEQKEQVQSLYQPKKLLNLNQAANKQPIIGDFQADEPSKIQTGMEVIHERFGNGKVISLDGISPNVKATVFFPEAGQKQLLLKFAKLKIV